MKIRPRNTWRNLLKVGIFLILWVSLAMVCIFVSPDNFRSFLLFYFVLLTSLSFTFNLVFKNLRRALVLGLGIIGLLLFRQLHLDYPLLVLLTILAVFFLTLSL